jgi:hypothetical protein
MSLLTGSCANETAEETRPPKAEVKSRPNSVSLPVKELLRHFEAPGVPPPPSARVGDPKLKQKASEPFKLWDLWQYGAFAAWKGEYEVVARGCPRPARARGVPLEDISQSLSVHVPNL